MTPSYIHKLKDALDTLDLAYLAALGEKLRYTRQLGRCLFVVGNGGSSSVAQHWAVDLNVAGLRTMCLGTNQGILTAYSNDRSYEVAYATELESWSQPGDVLVALSCSGRSPNIISALGKAHIRGVAPYLISGLTCPTYLGFETMRVRSKDFGVIEDVFGALGHYFTEQLS